MFFVLSSGAAFAQDGVGDDPTGSGETITDPSYACMHDVPARIPISVLMEEGYNGGVFDSCRDKEEPFVIHEVPADPGSDDPDNPDAHNGAWGVKTGFSKGSSHCSWTFYYVYSVKCGNEVLPYTVKVKGGDTMAPYPNKRDKEGYAQFEYLTRDQEGLNECYDNRPVAPLAEDLLQYFSDNCDHVKNNGYYVKKDTRVRNDDCGWIEIHTYRVQDYCSSNVYEFHITYSGADEEQPEWVGDIEALFPDMKDVECADLDEILNEDTTMSYTDNCAKDGRTRAVVDTSKLGEGCEGGYVTRTWTAKDDCNEPIVYTQRIDVLPAPKATFEDQGPISVPCVNRDNIASYIPKLDVSNGGSGRCNISEDDIAGVYDPAQTDCGTFDVTYTFTDNCGRVTEKVVQVTIVDDQDPGITYAARDLVVDCGPDNVNQYLNWVATMGGATAEDNCTPTEELSWSHNAPESPITNLCGGTTGSTTVIFIVKDLCGNQSKTYATFTIRDITDPTFTDAINQTVVCDGEGNIEMLDEWLNDNGGATAKDTCSDVTWSNDFQTTFDDKYFDIREHLQGGCTEGYEGNDAINGRHPADYTGYIKVTFRATDACGNYIETVGTFSIEDSIAPVITDAADKTVECDGSGNTAEMDAWVNSNGGATAEPDYCSFVTWSAKEIDSGGDACDMYYTYEFTASDLCGNESSTIATFHIVDTTNPLIGLEAQDVTFECNDYNSSADRLPPPLSWEQVFEDWLARNGDAEAMDPCSGFNIYWDNNYDDAKVNWELGCGNTRSITITFIAYDECGWLTKDPAHASATTATFSVVDTKAPSI
ncbi:hypothetical protein U0L90_14555, partial [Flavobacteriaceae sp. LMIT009]